jgi:hypothetical protein
VVLLEDVTKGTVLCAYSAWLAGTRARGSADSAWLVKLNSSWNITGNLVWQVLVLVGLLVALKTVRDDVRSRWGESRWGRGG